MKKVKVAIIGAGTAGLTARRQVSSLTEDYLVFDNGPLGTTCARVGCMPSKVLIQIADDFHRRHHYADMGIRADNMSIDVKAALKHMRSLRERFVRGVLRDMQAWQDEKLIRKRARFIDHDTLEAGGQRYKAERIIIATGSKPIIPEEWKPFRHRLIDTDQFFELEDLPKQLAVIGLGVIGLELGQALFRLGTTGVAVTMGKEFGGLTDPKMQEAVLEALNKEFPIDHSGVKTLTEVDKEGKKVLAITSGKDLYHADAALVALGRKPVLADLGLEHLGISTDDKGIPALEDGTFRIRGTNIFLVGDVNGVRPVLHEASDEGRIAGYNATSDEPTCFRRRTSMTITFTDPNIALVGESWRSLTEGKKDFVTGHVSFRGQGRAIVKHKEVGDLHIYADRESGRILGAEMFAPDGEHHAHLLAWAIESKLTVHEALAMPFYHPVTEEGLRTALRDAAKQVTRRLSPLELMRCSDAPVR